MGNCNKIPTVLDFNDPKPTEFEEELHGKVQEILDDSDKMIQTVTEFKGCTDLVQKSLKDPTEDNQTECFEGLLVVVEDIKSFYDYSSMIVDVLPELMTSIFEEKSLEEVPTLAFQFAKILEFAVTFDQIRIAKFEMSNNFACYRRQLVKFSKHPDVVVGNDEASAMALFTAEHIPMMSAISKCLQAQQAAQEKEESKILEGIANFANTCMEMVRGEHIKGDLVKVCIRAMVGAIILFDTVDELGAFHKRSLFEIRSCLDVLKKFFEDEGERKNLARSLKFSSVHLNDDNTPGRVIKTINEILGKK